MNDISTFEHWIRLSLSLVSYACSPVSKNKVTFSIPLFNSIFEHCTPNIE